MLYLYAAEELRSSLDINILPIPALFLSVLSLFLGNKRYTPKFVYLLLSPPDRSKLSSPGHTRAEYYRYIGITQLTIFYAKKIS